MSFSSFIIMKTLLEFQLLSDLMSPNLFEVHPPHDQKDRVIKFPLSRVLNAALKISFRVLCHHLLMISFKTELPQI